jgi:hypothetical protein
MHVLKMRPATSFNNGRVDGVFVPEIRITIDGLWSVRAVRPVFLLQNLCRGS